MGEAYLLSRLETDDGARQIGEFGIGTNANIQQATNSTLFDEKIAGTIHLTLGNSYPETGGQNDSVLRWSMVHDLRAGGTITVDDDLFMEDGRFRV